MTQRLYEIADQLRAIFDEMEQQADENDGAIPQALVERLRQSEEDLATKLAGCCSVRSEAIATSVMLEKEIARLTRRKNASDKRVEFLADYMQASLESLGVESMEVANKWKLRIQPTPGAVQIQNADLVPKQYVLENIERKISKSAIAEELKAGRPVPGCSLLVGKKLRVY